MIPILKNGNTTSGFLKDAVSCVVTEERNGIYELQMTYPLTGQHAKLITVGMNILAKPNDTSENQLFQIYEVTKPISGIFTVKAEHISYQLSHHPASSMDLGTTSANSAMYLLLNLSPTNTDFLDVWTDVSLMRPFSFTVGSIRAGLGGSKGSILDVFGGEFEFDNYTVKLHRNRGSDNGVIIAYRKNLTDLKLTTSIESSYTALYPYCLKDDVLTTLNPSTISVTNTAKIPTKILIKDFTSFFENDEEITKTALKEKAEAWLDENDINSPSINLSVSFQHLWQSPEYASLKALEKVSLCDTVTIWHSELGVNIKTKVIKTVYDTLGEKYEKIELGSAKANFADTLIQSEQKLETEIEGIKNTNTNLHSQITQEYLAAIDEATETITGNSGGYVVLYPSSFPQELLIMNQPYIDTATKLWRFNLSGFGYSSTGYNGTFKTAITMDGKINADFITTGTLTANIIRAGCLTAADGSAYFDLESGEISTSSANITGGYISIGDDRYRTEIIDGAIMEYSSMTESTNAVGGMIPVGSGDGHHLGIFCGYPDDVTGVTIMYSSNSKNSIFTTLATFGKDLISFRKNLYTYAGIIVAGGDLTCYNNAVISEDLNVLGMLDCFGKIYSEGYLVSSTEEIKENIHEPDEVLNLIKESKIYSYNYIHTVPSKPQLLEAEELIGDVGTIETVMPQTFKLNQSTETTYVDENESYGFVIERETPTAVIAGDGKHVDIYSMAAIAWKGIQELLVKVEALEETITNLQGE